MESDTMNTLSDDLNFLTDGEREETLKAEQELELQRKMNEDSFKLAESLALDTHAEGKFKRKTPLGAQAQLIREAEREKLKEMTEKEKEIQWCKKKAQFRLRIPKITHVGITGRKRRGELQVELLIFREDLSKTIEYPRYLDVYGLQEWSEIIQCIQSSKSKYKSDIEQRLLKLLNRISQVVDLPPLPKKAQRKTRAKSVEDAPSQKNEHETKFSLDMIAPATQLPDLSMLNLLVPPMIIPIPSTVYFKPEHGLVFFDPEGEPHFFRASEVFIAPTKFLDYVRIWCDTSGVHGQMFEKKILREMSKRASQAEASEV